MDSEKTGGDLPRAPAESGTDGSQHVKSRRFPGGPRAVISRVLMFRPYVLLTLMGAAVTVTFASSSRGEDKSPATTQPALAVVEPSPALDTARTRPETQGPNFVLMGGGVVAFGVAYGVSVIAAASSGRAGDDQLFVPVLGPWIDLGRRAGCGAGSLACDTERGNEIGLAIDGVLQGMGVLAIIGGLVFQGTRDAATPAAPEQASFRVAPVQYPHGGGGLLAAGSF